MHSLSLIQFLLVSACFSAPSIRGANVPNNALPSLPPGFIKPTTAPVFVALLTGFYDYSCPQNGAWQFSWSNGQVFDITSIFDTSEFANIQNDAFNDLINSHTTDPFDPAFAATIESKYGIKLLGKYANTSNSADVDFSSTGGGSVDLDVTADAEAPVAPAINAAWQEMEATSGTLAKTVLLIETKGGAAPLGDCEPGTPDSLAPICAQLWGF